MTLAAALRRVKFKTSGKTCPKSTSLGLKQERYIGYAGVEFGTIPALCYVSTAFQRGMTQRDAVASVMF